MHSPLAPSPADHQLMLPVQTFFRAPMAEDISTLDVDVAMLGIPYDAGTGFPYTRSGSSAGASTVRGQPVFFYEGGYFESPPPLGTRCAGWYDIEEEKTYLEGVTMADVGDIAISGGSTVETFNTITSVVDQLVGRTKVVAGVGGDHSISIAVGRGLESLGQVDLVHFDAHADFTDVVNGSRVTHGSNVRRLSEMPWIRNITAIGLRNVTKSNHDAMRERGVNIITAKRLVEEGPEVIREVMPESENLYVSIDTDVFDAGLVPATTLPEPFGIAYRPLRAALEVVASMGNVRCFDIVEMTGLQGIASPRTTSWIMAHFLSAIFENQG